MADIIYPWKDESGRKRPDFLCSFADLVAAYARVQARFEARMAALREAEHEDR